MNANSNTKLSPKPSLLLWVALALYALIAAALFIVPEETPRILLAYLTYSSALVIFFAGSWWHAQARPALAFIFLLFGWAIQMVDITSGAWMVLAGLALSYLVEHRLQIFSPDYLRQRRLWTAIALLIAATVLWKISTLPY